MEKSTNNITVMLNQWIAGDNSVENDLIGAVYPLLRDIARESRDRLRYTYFHGQLVK